MNKSVSVPEDLYDKAAWFAARDNVSVDEFVSAILASRLASGEDIESVGNFSRDEEFGWSLDQITDVEPEDSCRL